MRNCLLDREVEQVDAIGQVAERDLRRSHEADPDGQISDRKCGEIGGVGNLQQDHRRDRGSDADNGGVRDPVAIKVDSDSGKERCNENSSLEGSERTDRIPENRAGGGGEQEQRQQRDKKAPKSQSHQQRDNRERHVALELERNRP